MKMTVILGAIVAFAAMPTMAQERVRASVACKPTGEKLTYDCTIDLKDAKSGAAVDKADLTVGADMPSMPMAHNVKPVAAKAGSHPGNYQARLVLEMFGDWAVHVTVNAPIKDKQVQVLNFTQNAVAVSTRPAQAAAPGTRQQHNHHRH